MIKKLITIALLLVCSIGSCFANDNVTDVIRHQGLTYTNTEVLNIHSKYVNKDYKIYVDVPVGYYHHSQKKYPAVFLLDADYSFSITKAIVEHLEDRNRMKKVFLIGVAYDGPPQYKLNRSRDYTPWHSMSDSYNTACDAVTGGSSKFAEFLKNELIPALDKHYHLSTSRTLVGHSFGGLFCTWLSLSSNVFNSYVIVSPSFWYKNKKIFNFEKSFSKTHHALNEKIYFGIGDKENAHFKMVSDLRRYVDTLKSRQYSGLKMKFQISPNQDHDTIFPTAVTAGLLYIYGKAQ